MTPVGNNFNDFSENPLIFACSLNSRPIKAKWFTGVCGAIFKKPLATDLVVLICVIDVGLHYFLFNFNRWLSFPHMLIGRVWNVDMSITVCLFVCKFVTLYGYGFLRRG